MKFLVGGPSPSGTNNRGDEAVFLNFCEGMRTKFPGCLITYLVRHPGTELDAIFGEGVRSVKNFDHVSKQESLGRWFHGFNFDDSTEHLVKIRKAVEEADLVVIGGSPFVEIADNEFLRGEAYYCALLGILAKFFQKPLVLYGVAAHPIKNDLTKYLAKFLCENAELITLREAFSKQQLLNVGVRNQNMHVLSDPAFGLEPIRERRRALRILEQEGIRLEQGPLIGVTFRHMYYLWQDNEANQYGKMMADVCDFMVEKLEAQILFIPNMTYSVDTPNEDDRVFAKQIKQLMKQKDRAHVIDGEHSIHETLPLFQLPDFVVANRRHSCVFGAIHHVPMLAIATENSWNLQPVIDEMLPGQLANLTDSDLESLKKKLAETWMNRRRLKCVLAERIPQLRRKAHQHTELIAETVLK